MAESTIEVRLVRCPKCKNLLPEPKDCSFFQCGGCGTVLCAKNKDPEADPMSENSVKNRAKETEVHSSSSDQESESDTSLRHQQVSQTETRDVHSDPCNNDSQSDSVCSDDRAGLVRTLDKLKEQFLQPKEQKKIPSSSPGFKKSPFRFPSYGKNVAGGSMHQPAYGGTLEPSHSSQYIGNNGHGLFNTPTQNRMMLDQSTCLCFHCYDPYHRASGSVFAPSGLLDALHNFGFHSPRSSIPHHHHNGSQLHGRCLSKSENGESSSGPRRQSSCSEQDKVTLSKTDMRQNSTKEASVAIEMDVNDYSQNCVVSQDSANDYKEYHGRTKKGRSASIMKNSFSFKDLKNSIQNEGKSDVFVNGYPVAEHLVKMAEKQAGPIRPGNYWYDYRAGFWGIMGNQCLGILPPFIEELNYPMPVNCAGGATRVFVNGRELHQKDLRLLTARGLPRDRDRSYTVYMSGRVIDEDTGEELQSLGKLAPTVDKLKRGFGMRVPRKSA